MGRLHDYLWESDSPECTITNSLFVSKSRLLAYRIFAFIGIIVILITLVLTHFIKNLKYLTYLGVITVGIYFLCSIISSFMYKNMDEEASRKPFALWKFAVVLFEITFSIEVLIPIFYWTVLYPGEKLNDRQFLESVCVHAITPGLIYIDLIFNKIKFYKRHWIILALFMSLYGLVNFLVTKTSGKPVYKVLTWEDFSTFLYLLLALVITVLGFGLGYITSELKFKKKKKEKMSVHASYASLH